MARNPSRTDLLTTTIRHAEEIRGERIKSRAHCEIKNYIVAVDPITAGMVIPRLFIGINPDDASPEWKMLHGFAAVLGAGTCTIEWSHNGALVATQDVTTSEGSVDLDPPVELAHLDTIQPTITAASSAAYLTAAVVMVTSAR